MKICEYFVLVCLLAMGMPPASVAQAQDNMPNSAVATAEQGANEGNIINCGTFVDSDPKLELVSKLCSFALTYREKLPDFIAQQTTTSRGPGTTVVMTAQVTYRKGEEHHSDVTVNGKPMPPDGRVNANLHLFTNGEFGPLLINLFEIPDTIEFKFSKTDTLLGVSVAVFDFHLPKARNTFWAIRDPKGETLKPEFHGHLWIETQTGRIMREEVEPVVNAWQTGVNSMKLSADYSMTKVSDLGIFLLPVKSESTVCLNHLGTTLGCTTNVIAFHNYQKFVANSRIMPAETAP